MGKRIGEVVYDDLDYYFIELINFNKTEIGLQTNLDRLLFVLKNLSKLDNIHNSLYVDPFPELFDLVEYTNLTKNDQEMYDEDLKRRRDNREVLDCVKDEAREEGLQIGFEKGLEKGREEGRTGERLETIKRMIVNSYLSDAHISKLLDIPVEVVKNVRLEMFK